MANETKIGLGFLVDESTHQLPSRARAPLQVDSGRLVAGGASRANCASDLSASEFEQYAFGKSEDCTVRQDDAPTSDTVTDEEL